MSDADKLYDISKKVTLYTDMIESSPTLKKWSASMKETVINKYQSLLVEESGINSKNDLDDGSQPIFNISAK